MRLPFRNRVFWAGIVAGIVAVAVGRLAINESTVPDYLVAPLLVKDSPASADAVVVLGGGVLGECVLNIHSMRRIMLGARLFKEGRAPLLVVSGGQAGGRCPVADGMANLAKDLGVPADRIVIEREASSTEENARRTAPLLRGRGVSHLVLVTDRLHMKRAIGVFEHQGFDVEPSAVPIYEVHPDNVSMLLAGARESVALAYYGARGWTERAPVMASTAPPQPDVARARFQPADAWPDGPLVILGASYAANWPLTDVDGIPVVNAGVAGQQSFEMARRFERDVVTAQPRAVLIWGFINDLFRADPMADAVPRIQDQYESMLARARAEGIEPILATEVTIRPPKNFVDDIMATVGWLLGRTSYQDQINRYVMEVNGWLRARASREGILLLDLQSVVADTDGQRLRAHAADDGSHLSPEGYDALTAYAVPLLGRRLDEVARARRP
ncbi:MAG: ElyC/SanA/YdcF family protein [Vicinamibacterales bacterium]